MKHIKKLFAVALALTMVFALTSSVWAGPEPAAEPEPTQYTITVTNTNEQVSIAGKTFKAIKLFDGTYSGTTTTGVDNTPHAYYLSTTSPFYAGTSYDATATPAWTYGTYTTILKDYFDFTIIPGDSSKIIVEPKATYTEAAAYEMAQKLDAAGLSTINTTGYVFTGTAGAEAETLEINATAGGPGYYLVTGEGKSDDGTDPVYAAVALTTTDPAASINAKLTGNELDKSIDEGTTAGQLDEEDPKEDTHAVGDKVPYVLTTKVPDMTGYENYFFVINDTFSKGLTYNNDLKIVIVYDKQYVEHLTSTLTDTTNQKYTVTNGGLYYKTAAGEYTATAPVLETGQTPDDLADQYEVRNHEFVKYTDIVAVLGFTKDTDTESPTYNKYVKTLVAGTDYTVTPTAVTPEAELEIIFKDFYNKVNGLTGADITLTYSATINSDAVISDGDTLNPNTNSASLTFSNNPNALPNPVPGNPDKPGPDSPTGETPDQVTKTYVTGIKLTKANGTGSTAEKLPGATFELTGEALNQVVETTKKVFVEDENGTYYLLKDGTYTETVPVTDDTLEGYNATSYVSTTDKYKQVTLTSYATQDAYYADAEGGFVKKTDDSYEAYNAEATYTAEDHEMADETHVQRYKKGAKYTVTTDENGVITFTGLNEGTYTLTELVAPEGYNALKTPIQIVVTANYNQTTGKFTGFTVTKDGTAITGDSAEIFPFTVVNQSGTELPSTGGIGTTIFYVVGAILVIGAGILLVSRRRMAR